MSGMGLAMMGTGIAEGEDRAIDGREARDLEPAARGRVGERRARRDHQRDRRSRPVADRGERGVDDRAGSGRRGRQHHLRRRGRSDADRQGEDHGDRDRLRPGRHVRSLMSGAQTPIDLSQYADVPPPGGGRLRRRQPTRSRSAKRRRRRPPRHRRPAGARLAHGGRGVGTLSVGGDPTPSSTRAPPSTCRRFCAARKAEGATSACARAGRSPWRRLGGTSR